jgi:hypothetical protein
MTSWIPTDSTDLRLIRRRTSSRRPKSRAESKQTEVRQRSARCGGLDLVLSKGLLPDSRAEIGEAVKPGAPQEETVRRLGSTSTRLSIR